MKSLPMNETLQCYMIKTKDEIFGFGFDTRESAERFLQKFKGSEEHWEIFLSGVYSVPELEVMR